MAGFSIEVGERYGDLTVVSIHERRARKNGTRLFWLCLCACGNEHVAESSNLRAGNVVRCKTCTTASRKKGRHKTHGHAKQGRPTKAYYTWLAMRRRCSNQNDKSYERYGGRGISVDPRWDTFERFLADMGEPPSPDHQIERKDNDGPYSPENCIWATRQRQANNKSNNRLLEVGGVYKTLAQWCRDYGIDRDRVRARLDKGWSLQDALERPLRYMSQKFDYETPDGTFLSLRMAAEHHGMSVSGANTRFNSSAFPCWRRIPRA